MESMTKERQDLLVDAARYPILDEKQLGQLNRIVQLADQADDDWDGWLMPPGMKGGDEHVRYQLAFMNYALAAAVYNYTPAYRQLGERVSNNMIRKMIDYISWGDIVIVSQGNPLHNPVESLPLPTKYDPIQDFIMYSGHLLQMLVSHEMLYNDMRFSQPNSLTFQHPPTFGFPEHFTAVPGKVFKYDLNSLVKQIYDQFEKNGWKGAECFPGAVFTLCNQNPILGLKLYDQKHSTGFFAKVSQEYKAVREQEGFLDPKTKSWAFFCHIHEKNPGWTGPNDVGMSLPGVDGWVGAFMHAWDRDAVEKVYPAQRDSTIVTLPDGTGTVRLSEMLKDVPGGDKFYGQNHGYFAVMAAELGDTATKEKMLNYADKYFAPKWEGESYYYPISPDFGRPGDPPNVVHFVTPLASSALLALARILPKDGLYNMYNHPFTDEHFKEPFVSDVTYPEVQVPRAVYDQRDEALVVTLRPGRTASTSAVRSWTFNNLDSKRDWGVWKDGRKIATLNGGAVRAEAGVTGLEAQGTTLKVSMPVEKETTFIVARE